MICNIKLTYIDIYVLHTYIYINIDVNMSISEIYRYLKSKIVFNVFLKIENQRNNLTTTQNRSAQLLKTVDLFFIFNRTDTTWLLLGALLSLNSGTPGIFFNVLNYKYIKQNLLMLMAQVSGIIKIQLQLQFLPISNEFDLPLRNNVRLYLLRDINEIYFCFSRRRYSI